MIKDDAGPSWRARQLGYGGLLPFVGLALLAWGPSSSGGALAVSALTGYAAVIASFLGAIHWGLAMRDGPAVPAAPLLWGVVPSLVAWGAALLGGAAGLLLLVVLLWLCFAVDRVRYPRYGLRAWLPMRWQLTLVATLACLGAAAATLAHPQG